MNSFLIWVSVLLQKYVIPMQLSRDEVLAHANAVCKNTLMETLNIQFIDFGEDFVTARMPVNTRSVDALWRTQRSSTGW